MPPCGQGRRWGVCPAARAAGGHGDGAAQGCKPFQDEILPESVQRREKRWDHPFNLKWRRPARRTGQSATESSMSLLFKMICGPDQEPAALGTELVLRAARR